MRFSEDFRHKRSLAGFLAGEPPQHDQYARHMKPNQDLPHPVGVHPVQSHTLELVGEPEHGRVREHRPGHLPARDEIEGLGIGNPPELIGKEIVEWPRSNDAKRHDENDQRRADGPQHGLPSTADRQVDEQSAGEDLGQHG